MIFLSTKNFYFVFHLFWLLYYYFFFKLESESVKSLCHVRLFSTPQTVAHQASLSMGCSRQEYWSGLPFPSPGDLPKPDIKPRSHALQANSLPSQPPGSPFYMQYSWFKTLCFMCTAKWFIYEYIYLYVFFFRFFFHIGCYRMLSRAPCAVQ